MIEHMVIAFILTLFGWLCLDALGKVIDWLESIYDRMNVLIGQNEDIKRNMILNTNDDELEFIEIKGNKNGINGAEQNRL